MQSFPRLALGATTVALAVALTACSGGESSGLTRVKTAIATRDNKTVLIELKSFLQKYPKSTEGRFLLGQQLAKNSEFAAAVAEFQRALEAGMPSQQVLPSMARAMVKAGAGERLVSLYKDEKLADPQAQASLSASIAAAMATRGDANGATALIDRVLAQTPTSAPARLMKARLDAAAGRVDEGMKRIDAVVTEFPNDVDAWIAKGDFLMRLPNRGAAAAEAFGKALALQPDDLYALATIVPLQLGMGQVDAARKVVAHMTKIAPTQFLTARADAAVAYATGDHAHAREVLQQLLKAAPTHVPLLLLAGENELRLNALTQAEAIFAKAAALEPANPVARRLLGQAQLRLGQVPKALVTLEPLVDAPEASADVLALAAEARTLNGDARLAQSLYERMAKLKPADPRLRTLVATAGFGRVDDAAVFDELRQIATSDTGTSANLALINAHLARGQADAALKALAELEQKQPQDPAPRHMRGQVLARMGKTAESRAGFEAALALRATYLPSIVALAALDMREGKADQAKERLAALVKAQPRNATAMLALAEVLQRTGAPSKEVRAQLNAAVKALPADVSARVALVNHHLAANDGESALNAALAASAAMPDNLEILALLARCQIRQGSASQALATYGKMTTLQPKSPQGHLGMTEVHLAANQLDLAQRSINRTLELAPGLTEARAQAIVVAMRQKQPAKAQEIARQVQADRPTDATGFILEADVLMRQRQWAPAAAVLRKALDKQAPGIAPVKLYQALARGDKPADAENFAAQWLKAHPNDTSLLFTMGEMAQSKSDYASAHKHYERIIAIQPDHPLALNNLAMLMLLQKKPGALDLAKRAVAAKPNEPAVLDTLALAQAAAGETDEAVKTQRQALSLSPNAAEIRLGLAKLLIQAGEPAQAKAELEKLAKLEDRFPLHQEVEQLRKGLVPVLPGR